MKRFDVINASKFERLSNADMSCVKGGDAHICIFCMKRSRKVPIELVNPKY